MRTPQRLALGGLVFGLSLMLVLASPAQEKAKDKDAPKDKEPAKGKDAPKDAPKGKEAPKDAPKAKSAIKEPPREENLVQRVARQTKLKEDEVLKVLTALGPAVLEDLKRGRSVGLPGLGQFRVVQVPAHRDLRDGRPVTVPARNSVEFLPESGVDTAANSATAKPATSVEPFKYEPLPTQTKGQRTSGTRAPNTRVP